MTWRVDGLMVSLLDSGSIGPKWSQTGVAVSCSQARHLTLAMSLSTEECKWYWLISEGNLAIAGGHLQWTSIPSKGGGGQHSWTRHVTETGVVHLY